VPIRSAISALPGLALCTGITLAAIALERVEAAWFGRAWLEALVLAILLGIVVRAAWKPGARFRPGIHLSGKLLLEIAVVLLGASLSAGTVIAAGPRLLLGIVVVVAAAIAASYAIGRALGLRHHLAVLVACGNSICGNSAIAAVAPVIGADGEDVAASIAFTAVLGVAVVLGLPLLVPALHLSGLQYGAFAGLTVYAVPQVLAATAPLGAVAVQIGTLVKLVRVLMLGPVVLLLSMTARAEGDARPGLARLVPWFILGFLALAACRSLGLVPPALVAPAAHVAGALTIVSMAALGLGTDLRSLARAGGRVTSAVTLSLAVLGAISLALVRGLGIG
jgi:uncharacterized integral membrane protein (TIGR00698 family)